MKIGIISEGHADRAVITNLLASFGIDSSMIEPLRPIYNYDETDKALNPLTFSNWSIVKQECEDKELIEPFLAIEGQDFIIIHLDTAEAELYNITRPVKDADYCETLRLRVIDEIKKWLTSDFSEQILFAIAIEETEAWIIPIFESRDSSIVAKPKERLDWLLRKTKLSSKSDYGNFIKLSKPLSKTKEIRRGNFLDCNCSLAAFYEEVRTKIEPKLNL